MKIFLSITFIFFLFDFSIAQLDTSKKSSIVSVSKDSSLIFKPGNTLFPYNKKRTQVIEYGQAIAYATNFASLYSLWYKDYPKSNFHFFNDFPEYLQVDKVSHMWGAYTGGNISMQMWKWAGASKKKYVWLGGMTGLAYETVIEVMDGFSDHWGFSVGDYGANILGTSLLIGQELAWNEQRITMKFSTHYETYEPIELERFAQKIDGKDVLGRILKNYNPQTYWLSFNIKSFFPKAKVPAWFNLALGYGGENIVGSKHTDFIYADGTSINVDNLYPQYRQWYLAPDVDFTRIKTKSKLLKTALFVLNSFKFPTPSLEFSQGGFKFNWFHF